MTEALPSLSDPEFVRREYEREDGLRARASVYQGVAGPDARDLVVEAVAAARPRRVLEVGCGWGELAERIRDELGADVTAIDLSPRMVELARERGIDAQVGDAQALPFDDGSFDCAVAAWMLYHVPDVRRAIAELARVLVPGGRLVAATNGADHLAELWDLVGRDKVSEVRWFLSEDAEELLRAEFAEITRTDARSAVTFPDAAAVRGYVGSSVGHKHLVECVSDDLAPLVAMRHATVFVGEKAG